MKKYNKDPFHIQHAFTVEAVMIIHSVCTHGFGITVGNGVTIDLEPVHEMEKLLFAADELTKLICSFFISQ